MVWWGIGAEVGFLGLDIAFMGSLDTLFIPNGYPGQVSGRGVITNRDLTSSSAPTSVVKCLGTRRPRCSLLHFLSTRRFTCARTLDRLGKNEGRDR